MGDYAEMVLEGQLCVNCTAYTGKSPGHETLCSDCLKKMKSQKSVSKKKDSKIKESSSFFEIIFGIVLNSVDYIMSKFDKK